MHLHHAATLLWSRCVNLTWQVVAAVPVTEPLLLGSHSQWLALLLPLQYCPVVCGRYVTPYGGVCRVWRGPHAGRRHACELCLRWSKLQGLCLEQTLRCVLQPRGGANSMCTYFILYSVWHAGACSSTCNSLLILLHEGHHAQAGGTHMAASSSDTAARPYT